MNEKGLIRNLLGIKAHYKVTMDVLSYIICKRRVYPKIAFVK